MGPPRARAHRLWSALLGALLGLTACSGAAASDCGVVPPGFAAGTVDVGDARLHHVIGGQGPAVVLLHGFPETWWTWRDVLPVLARNHTVVALDLRGVGCSSLAGGGYDAQTMAADVQELVAELGLGPVAVVGHDTGGWVAYAYARRYRENVTHLVLSGAALPGFGLEELLDFRTPGRGLPHLVLHAQPGFAELVRGREHEYVERFVTSETVRRSGALEVYARSYALPGRLDAALGQYRAIYTDAADNLRGASPPLAVPTLALAAPGEIALSAGSLHRVAADVHEVAVPGAGHYVQEERPAEFAEALAGFLDGV